MKWLAWLAVLCGFVFTSPVLLAEEDTVNIFNIGEPPHPVISDAMMAKSRQVATAHATELLEEPGDVVVGNPIGGTTFVQFVDFLCSKSQTMDPDIQKLVKANPDLRVVYKPYPIRGSVSVFAAKAALAANLQGKYLPMHIALMAQHGDLDDAKVIAIAKSLGLDMATFMTDMNDKSFETLIKENHELATEINIPGTPAMFFAKTSTTPTSNPDLLGYLLGLFTQPELQAWVNKINSEP